MKWCNSQASASCFNSQVQTSCASFSMALLLLKMLALGWGARKMCKEKDWTQISWFDSRAWCLKACDASTTRHNGAMPNEACMHQFHIEAVRPGWNIFCRNLTKKMLSNLKTLSKIKSKSHTHTHASVQILTKTQESCVWMWNPQWHARTVGSKTCALWKLNHLPVPVLVERCKTNWCHLRANLNLKRDIVGMILHDDDVDVK